MTATDGCKSVTRDKNQLKKVHPRPASLKPSWERGVTFDYTSSGIETRVIEGATDHENSTEPNLDTTNGSNVPANGEETLLELPNNSVDSSDNAVAQSSPVRISDDMAAHMAHLFAQAERAAQDTEEIPDRAITRSAGRTLKWNSQMNTKDVLVEDNEVN